MNHHPCRLRPYHNPDNVDESKVPAGWRFRYADEAGTRANGPCVLWVSALARFGVLKIHFGRQLQFTYIVPVKP
jgi:hypothetical protein